MIRHLIIKYMYPCHSPPSSSLFSIFRLMPLSGISFSKARSKPRILSSSSGLSERFDEGDEVLVVALGSKEFIAGGHDEGM